MFHGAEARITGTKIQGSGFPPQAGKRANQAGKAKMTGQLSNRTLLLTSQDSRAGQPRSGYTKQVRARPARHPKQQESEPRKTSQTAKAARERAGQDPPQAGQSSSQAARQDQATSSPAARQDQPQAGQVPPRAGQDQATSRASGPVKAGEQVGLVRRP